VSTPPAEPLDVRSGYDLWAPGYDQAPNRTRDAAMARFRTWTDRFRNARVLELGCGTGLNTEHLADHARAVVALDFSEAMLERAKSRLHGRGVEFLSRDLALGLPFADANFDVVVETLVLEHLPELGPLFAEAARVLRPGGRLLLAELHPYRQLLGRQARIETADGEATLIRAFTRSVSDFVGAGLGAGFTLKAMTEDFDPSGEPRLLGLEFRLP